MKEWKINLLLVLGGLVVALAFAEGILRLIGYANPNFYQADLDRGASLKPGARGWWTKEGHAYVRINSEGLHDREHALRRPPNTLRVAVLGDSYAEALQVPVDKAFWDVMERLLQRCVKLKGKKVEAINFGVAGYGTAEELLTLRHQVWPYDPDIIVLAFLTGNDLRDNSRALLGDSTRPYFVFHGDKLVLDRSFLDDPAFRRRAGWLGSFVYWITDYSRTAQLINEVRETSRQAKQETARKHIQTVLTPGFEAGLDDMVYLEPVTKTWREAWQVTEELIRIMNREVDKRDKRFLLVTLSNGIQVDPDTRKREAFATQLGVKDLFYPERRIRALAQRERIPFLALAIPMQQWAEKHGTCLHGFPNASPCGGHWNERGHRLAGELIADKICRELL